MALVMNAVRDVAHKARVARLSLTSWLLGSGKFFCNVCRRPVRAFLPLPDFYRQNLERHGWPYSFDDAETCHFARYSCPWCLASDRDRLIALAFDQFRSQWSPGRPLRMLEFAPSPALSKYFRHRLAGQTNVHRTADLFAANVDDRVDISKMTCYADGTWDLIVCSHVLEHVVDDRLALRELHRVLSPEGRAFLLVPIVLSRDTIDEDPSIPDISERWRRFGQDDHVRLYSKAGFIGRIREAGFRVDEWNQLAAGTDVFAHNGIEARSVLYIAKKDDT